MKAPYESNCGREPVGHKPCERRLRRFIPTLASLLIMGWQFNATAQSDNFNDGDDFTPVFWNYLDPIFDASGGASTPNTWDASTFEYHLTAAPTPDKTVFGPARTYSYPSANYTNFYASVDIKGWNNTYVQPFGILARAKEFGFATTDGYLFGYANADALLGPGNSYIAIIRMQDEFSFNNIPGTGTGGPNKTELKVDLDPAKDYRLVFIGMGTHLEGRVYELPNLTTPIAVVIGNTASDSTILTSGQCSLFAYNAYSAAFGQFEGPIDVTFDNYYASSRCPLNINDMVVKDDFNDGNDTAPPIAWQPYDPIGDFVGFSQNTWSFPGGNTYRLQAPVQPFNPQLGPGRVASLAPGVQTNFRIAVDVVNWDDTIDQNAIGLMARVGNPGLGSTTGYVFSYDVGGTGDVDLSSITNEAPTGLAVSGSDQIVMVPGNTYRFVFVGIGSELRGLVYELPETMNPKVDCLAIDATYASGQGGIIAAAASPTDTADATFDNYSDTPIGAGPQITIAPDGGGNATVSWPANLECIWILESSPAVGTGAIWTPVALKDVVYSAGQHTYTATTPMVSTGDTYYRLKRL